MLFNSLLFIFLFLPVSLGGYYLLCATPLLRWRFAFLSLMSMVFYAFASWRFAALLAVSTAVNLLAAKTIQRLRDAGQGRASYTVLAAGIVANLLFLCYFKYLGFFVVNLNAIAGTALPVPSIALPIGISFYTFLFMGALVDVARRDIDRVDANQFVSFSLFYPHLLAGPLVHYQELVPQIERRPVLGRIPAHILVGTVIFGIGLFKKTVFADTIALYVAPVFKAAVAGQNPGFESSWLAALSFTLQIYFDFSGYSDMAIGLARMFGFKLPLNFHSPLRARNIVDYWRRWHMTLQRFIVAYLFPALAIPMTRWAVSRRMHEWSDFAVSVAAPTMITFLVVGFWHGAGWTFLMFGAMHGFYIICYEAWKKLRRRGKWRRIKPKRPEILAAHAVLLLSIIVAHVVFRAETVPVSGRILSGMIGFGDANPPAASPALGLATNFVLVIIGYLFVLVLPNTQQIMGRYDPALNWAQWRQEAPPVISIKFRPTALWAISIGLILFFGVIFIMRGQSEFIYFRF
jgi:D-alanyl-lipoteichoic acid acyltransferase DltB (MBOAT superfamily)